MTLPGFEAEVCLRTRKYFSNKNELSLKNTNIILPALRVASPCIQSCLQTGGEWEDCVQECLA